MELKIDKQLGRIDSTWMGLTLEYEPLQVPGRSDYELFRLHSLGLLTCFLLMAGLLVVFLTRIAANLRERDARIAALRQSAAEEDHIVRRVCAAQRVSQDGDGRHVACIPAQ